MRYNGYFVKTLVQVLSQYLFINTIATMQLPLCHSLVLF
jgi:hypothetical protein